MEIGLSKRGFLTFKFFSVLREFILLNLCKTFLLVRRGFLRLGQRLGLSRNRVGVGEPVAGLFKAYLS